MKYLPIVCQNITHRITNPKQSSIQTVFLQLLVLYPKANLHSKRKLLRSLASHLQYNQFNYTLIALHTRIPHNIQHEQNEFYCFFKNSIWIAFWLVTVGRILLGFTFRCFKWTVLIRIITIGLMNTCLARSFLETDSMKDGTEMPEQEKPFIQ